MQYLKYIIFIFTLLISCNENESKGFVIDEDVAVEISESIVNTEHRLLLPDEFKAKMASYKEYYLVDVRTLDKLSLPGKIEGSVNIDFTKANFEEEIKKLNRGIPIFIYCRTGGRSAKACAELNGYGFDNVYELEGGYKAWLEKNKKSL